MSNPAKSHTKAVRAIRYGFLAGALIIWELASFTGLMFEGATPSVVKIVAATLARLSDPEFYRHALATVAELATAMALATAIGASLGMAMGINRLLGQATEPYLNAIGSAPKIIFLPIAISMLGLGAESKVALGTLGGFFPIALTTYVGVRQVRPVHLAVARTFFATRWQLLRKIYLPSLRRPLVVGIRLGFGGCFVTIILAEAKIGNLGLGYLAIHDYNHFRIPEMYGLLILMFAFAAGINLWLGRVADRTNS